MRAGDWPNSIENQIRLYDPRRYDYFCNMKPDDSYTKLQAKLGSLIATQNLTRERTKVASQLEKQFMAAWQFAPDRLRLGRKLADTLRTFRTKDHKGVRGFDHCTFYSGLHDQRIIVTQPYGALASDVKHDLTLDEGICPNVIDATEWAFYYPAHASLFIVKFPFGFKEAMDDFQRKLERAEREALLEKSHAEPAYSDGNEEA